MKLISRCNKIHGKITVPGSKSHTVRACLFAALGDGISYIRNPLESQDCFSAANAIKQFGATVDLHYIDKSEKSSCIWKITGAGKNIHLPDDVIDVGNSGSVLYFFSPVAATFDGWSIFTGDESIRTRPVNHLVDALKQLGCVATPSRLNVDAPPLVIKGPALPSHIITGGELSQYISGIMIAAARMNGTTTLTLTNPKEVPYLKMTCLWLSSIGIQVEHDESFKSISVSGPCYFPAIDRIIPSDWEAVAFPLVAAVITNSTITIENIDCSGSQGDDEIVNILQNMGASIFVDKANSSLTVNPIAQDKFQNLNTQAVLKGVTVNCSGFPDAVPALCIVACFAHGITRLEDIGVCRAKETDRISLMESELKKLGAVVKTGKDFIEIHGNGGKDLFGGVVESKKDHRVAMALSILGLAIPKGHTVTVNDAECTDVSFPGFVDSMNNLGANLITL